MGLVTIKTIMLHVMYVIELQMQEGENTLHPPPLPPPQIVVICIIFLQLIVLVMYGHHILDYFCFF